MNFSEANGGFVTKTIGSGDFVFPKSALAPLARFYDACGHRALLAGGSIWFNGGAFSMMSIPTTITPVISDSQVRKILFQSGKFAAVYRVEKPEGTTVPVFLLRDKNYGLNHLQRQFRQQVIGASSRMEARECSWEEWRDLALRCDRETFQRRGGMRGAHPLLLHAVREQAVEAARSVPGLHIHACFCGGEIVAYLVYIIFDGMCEGLLANRVDSIRDSADRHSAHLLYYSFAQFALARPDVQAVSVGRQSVPANEPLGRFKRHAGYLFEPCHLRIRLHPVLAPFLENRVASALLRTIRTNFSKKNPALTNLEVLERSALRG